MNFFFKELEIVRKHLDDKYDKNVLTHNEIKKIFKDKLIPFTEKWAKDSALAGYSVRPRKYWQINGAKFYEYTWAQIFKQKDEGKKIFFTVGIQIRRQCLLYKLDCQNSSPNSQNALTEDQQKRFYNLIEGDKYNVEIPFSDLENYDWERLISETKDYIKSYEHLYEQAFEAIYKEPRIVEELTLDDILNKVEETSFSDLDNTASPKGSGKINWNDANKGRTELGEMGEKFVLELEKHRLIKAGKTKLADEIKHISKDIGDHAGYDILSYETNGKEKYIEVKSTMSCDSSAPIYLTKNELGFNLANHKYYYLYRVYKFNKNTERGLVKVFKGKIPQQKTEPVVYKAKLN